MNYIVEAGVPGNHYEVTVEDLRTYLNSNPHPGYRVAGMQNTVIIWEECDTANQNAVLLDATLEEIKECPDDLTRKSGVDLQKFGTFLWGEGKFSINSYTGLHHQVYWGLGGGISIGLIHPAPLCGDDKAIAVQVNWVELIPTGDGSSLSHETMRKSFPIQGGKIDENALVLCIREVERQLKRNEWMALQNLKGKT